MTYRAGLVSGVLLTLFLLGVSAAAWWIAAAPKAEAKVTKPTPPATVGNVLKEDAVTGLELTSDAEKRLGIRTSPVTVKPMKRVRTYGGEVTIPPGRLIAVAAPLGGTLKAPGSGVPTAGAAVRKGQPIIELLPLLTPEARTTLASARVDADGQVANARTSLDAARIALDRAKNLLAGQAGSRRAVDEAQAQFDLANKTLEAATARRDMLVKVSGEVERGTAAPIALDAPEDGLLRTVSALPGQNVPAGAALFEVVDLGRVWVRVPVYVGDLAQIATADDAVQSDLAGRPVPGQIVAKPVQAPPSANALAATADLFYELDNRTAGLAPGQRIGMTLAIKGEAESLTVPWSAVVHDIYGGTWVYEQTGPRAFARRRVQVRHVQGDTAALATGPKAGTPVVVDGAAELFGTEVGFSK